MDVTFPAPEQEGQFRNDWIYGRLAHSSSKSLIVFAGMWYISEEVQKNGDDWTRVTSGLGISPGNENGDVIFVLSREMSFYTVPDKITFKRFGQETALSV